MVVVEVDWRDTGNRIEYEYESFWIDQIKLSQTPARRQSIPIADEVSEFRVAVPSVHYYMTRFIHSRWKREESSVKEAGR